MKYSKFANEETANANNAALLENAKSEVMRKGKTAKDRANGAARRCELNKGKRATWRNESKGGKNIPFPFETCSGKRHRPAGYKVKCKTRKRN